MIIERCKPRVSLRIEVTGYVHSQRREGKRKKRKSWWWWWKKGIGWGSFSGFEGSSDELERMMDQQQRTTTGPPGEELLP